MSVTLSLSLLCVCPAACNPSLCKAKGRGLQPKGLRIKETADFKVYTKGAGTGELKVTIKGPSKCTANISSILTKSLNVNHVGHKHKTAVSVFAEGLEEPCKRKDLGDGVYEFEYYPTTPGTYIITITWGGQHIPRRYTGTHWKNYS